MKKFEYAISVLHNYRARLEIQNRNPNLSTVHSLSKSEINFLIRSNKKDIKEITSAIKFLKANS